jgi:hypothetical protein
MPWVALRKLEIKRDGQYIEIQRGDEVPEAEFWPNRGAHIRTKRIAEVPFVGEQKKQEPVVISAPPVSPVVPEVNNNVEVISKPEVTPEEVKPAVEVKTRKRGRPKRKKVE